MKILHVTSSEKQKHQVYENVPVENARAKGFPFIRIQYYYVQVLYRFQRRSTNTRGRKKNQKSSHNFIHYAQKLSAFKDINTWGTYLLYRGRTKKIKCGKEFHTLRFSAHARDKEKKKRKCTQVVSLYRYANISTKFFPISHSRKLVKFALTRF